MLWISGVLTTEFGKVSTQRHTGIWLSAMQQERSLIQPSHRPLHDTPRPLDGKCDHGAVDVPMLGSPAREGQVLL